MVGTETKPMDTEQRVAHLSHAPEAVWLWRIFDLVRALYGRTER